MFKTTSPYYGVSIVDFELVNIRLVMACQSQPISDQCSLFISSEDIKGPRLCFLRGDDQREKCPEIC